MKQKRCIAERLVCWKQQLVLTALRTESNRGVLYFHQDKIEEAETMFQRALEGLERALGSIHPFTLAIVHNLATLYAKQGKLGRLAEAKVMYRRALEGYERALGPEHPSTLATVHNLDKVCSEHDKLLQAEVPHRRTLEGYERALGPGHFRNSPQLMN